MADSKLTDRLLLAVQSPDDVYQFAGKLMERALDAETVNERVIAPFIAAVEEVAASRGYVLNIYGDGSNLVVTGDEGAAEDIYKLVESYLDEREKAKDA